MLDLKRHFSRTLAAAPGRIHLAAHSHHFQPDVTRDAQIACWDDAARLADRKWGPIFEEVWPAVQRGVASRLTLPDPATLAFSPNTHDFLVRILSCLPADRRLSVLSTDGEFHSFTRQMDRLVEAGLVDLVRVPARPAETFSERFLNALRGFSGDLVFISQVFFDSGAVSVDLADLRGALPNDDMFVVVDGYHGFMALPTDFGPLADRAFYVGGGYKYAMAGENCCFLHCPPGYGPRPRITGWFASFGALSDARPDETPFGENGSRFIGSTFDMSGLYRQRAVFDWLDREGVTVDAIHRHAATLQAQFLEGLAGLRLPGLEREALITPVGDPARHGNFLTFDSPHSEANEERLLAKDIIVDRRGSRLRFGFGCYHTGDDIEEAVLAIETALGQ